MIAALTLALLPEAAAPPPARAKADPRYQALAARIQQMAVKDLKKPFEERSSWGTTIPIPPRLPFPRLKRTVVMVNGRPELPHGGWVRTKMWMTDPARDLRIDILEVQRPAKKPIRVKVRATVNGNVQRERQQWRRGVLLLGLTTQAEGKVELTLDCDVETKLDVATFPPAVLLKPTVVGATLELKEFTPRKLNGTAVEVVLDKATAEELKKAVNGLLRDNQEKVKELASGAIAQALKGGVKVSALELLRPAKP